MPASRHPHHFGRIALALSLLPWLAYALMRAFQLGEGLPGVLLQSTILLAVPAALAVSAAGVFSDTRKAYAIAALVVALTYAVTFFALAVVAVFRFVAAR